MSINFAEILHNKLLPWSQKPSLVVGREVLHANDYPPTVRVTRRPIRGKRVVVKDRRYYNNTRGLAALWPEAGLNQVNKLKLACVLNGHVDFQLGNYRLQCGPGHFIGIPAGMPHSDGSLPYVDAAVAESCDLVFFLLHPNALQCWITRAEVGKQKEQVVNYLVLNDRVVRLFRILMEEILSEEEGAEVVSFQLLPVFIGMLEREFQAERVQTVPGFAVAVPDSDLPLPQVDTDFAGRLAAHMKANLHQNLTIASVSREMFLSPAQFTRTVRRETGKSFHGLLTEFRLQESKQLLRNSEWTTSAIAAFVGYKSANHFRTFFRQHTGLTPNEFRQGVE